MEDIATKISNTNQFKSCNEQSIADAIKVAQNIVGKRNFPDDIIGYATYLYACHILHAENPSDGVTNIDAGTYKVTKSSYQGDKWLNAFNSLADDLGLRKLGKIKSLY